MQIKLNNESMQITSTFTLQALLDSTPLPATGLAAAINDRVIPHSSWAATYLKEDDEVTLFQAIAGG